MDDEHQAILNQFRTLVNLLSELSEPSRQSFVIRSFDRLSACLNFHFEHEESLLASAKYPGLDRRAAAHRALIQAVIDTCRQFELEPCGPGTTDMAAYLRDWWISHVNDIDAGYVSYVACPTTLRCPV